MLTTRKVFQIVTVRYNWPMSAHASQAFSIAHCTDSEGLPTTLSTGHIGSLTMHDMHSLGSKLVFFAEEITLTTLMLALHCTW